MTFGNPQLSTGTIIVKFFQCKPLNKRGLRVTYADFPLMLIPSGDPQLSTGSLIVNFLPCQSLNHSFVTWFNVDCIWAYQNSRGGPGDGEVVCRFTPVRRLLMVNSNCKATSFKGRFVL